MKIKTIISCSLLLMFIISSCSIQKRRYTTGYTTQWNKPHSKPSSNNQNLDTEVAVSEDKTLKENDQDDLGDLSVSIDDDSKIDISNLNTQNKNIFDDEKCDVITLRNGDEIEAKVSEITLTEIKYKKCTNLEGPTISVAKKDVLMIKYANGTKDIITADEDSSKKKAEQSDYVDPNPKDAEKAKKTEPLGIIGYILSLVGIFVAGIILGTIGVIFGLISLNKIKNHPEKYKSKKLYAILSIIIGVVAIIGGIIFIILLL